MFVCIPIALAPISIGKTFNPEEVPIIDYLPTKQPVLYAFKIRKNEIIGYAICISFIEANYSLFEHQFILCDNYIQLKERLAFLNNNHFIPHEKEGNYKYKPLLRMTNIRRNIDNRVLGVEELSKDQKKELISLLGWKKLNRCLNSK